MMEGPNFSAMQELLDILDCNLVASGGVSSVGDLEKLAAMSGL